MKPAVRAQPGFRRGETVSGKYERDSAYIHEMHVLVESCDELVADAAAKVVLEFLDARSKQTPLGDKRRAWQQASAATH